MSRKDPIKSQVPNKEKLEVFLFEKYIEQRMAKDLEEKKNSLKA